MHTTKRPTPEPVPTLLSKSDAMLHAADYLERQIGNIELISIFNDVLGKVAPDTCPNGEDEGRRAMADLRVAASGIVDKELQVAAMRSAAKEIRAQAHETKIAEARAAHRGINA